MYWTTSCIWVEMRVIEFFACKCTRQKRFAIFKMNMFLRKKQTDNLSRNKKRISIFFFSNISWCFLLTNKIVAFYERKREKITFVISLRLLTLGRTIQCLFIQFSSNFLVIYANHSKRFVLNFSHYIFPVWNVIVVALNAFYSWLFVIIIHKKFQL